MLSGTTLKRVAIEVAALDAVAVSYLHFVKDAACAAAGWICERFRACRSLVRTYSDERGDATDQRARVSLPMLSAPGTPWARRWAKVLVYRMTECT